MADILKIPGSQDPSNNPSGNNETETELDLDRVRLNEIMRAGWEPDARIGKEVVLTDDDKDQLNLVATKAEAVVAPDLASSDWKTFESLMEEGNRKGILLSFVTHNGTNVPTWCINGGEDRQVKKVIRIAENGSEQPGIQIPAKLFDVFNVVKTISNVKGFTQSDRMTTGRPAKHLSDDLFRLFSLHI